LKDNIKQVSAKSAVFNYIGKTVGTIVDAAVFILLTKKLMIEDYGVYSFGLAILSFFGFFLSFGIPTTLVRFIPEYIQKQERGIAFQIIKLSLRIVIIFGVFAIVSSFFIGGKVSVIFNTKPLSALFPLLVFVGISGIVLRIEEEILNALFMQAFRNIFQICADSLKLFLFILALNYGLGINSLFLAVSLVTIIQLVFYSVRIFNYFPVVKSEKKLPKKELRRFFTFSAKEYLFTITAFFWDMSFDIYVITYLLGSAMTGLFNFAVSMSFFVLHWSPGVILQPVISPLSVRQYAKAKDPATLNKIFQFYNKLKAFFAFPVILGSWSLVDKLVMVVYDNKFGPAVPALKILIISVMIIAFTIPIRNIFDVLEKNEFALYSNIVIIYRICASLFLIKYFGITGAAYAYGTSMLFIFLIQIAFLRRTIKVAYPMKSFLKILLNSSVMALFLIALKPLIGNSLFLLVTIAISGVLIYLLLSCMNKPFKKEERNIINEGLGFAVWHF